ncbi:MAG TPA: hypothetical protein VLI05_05710 [Candidatus Saccharimonadia bacterium]|nr:hypothetical protein [Candidatus Saccharimonadia bacterium]
MQDRQRREVVDQRAVMARFLQSVPLCYQFESYPSNSWAGGTFVSRRELPLLKDGYSLPVVLRSPADVNKSCGLKRSARRLFRRLLSQSVVVGSVTVTDSRTFTLDLSEQAQGMSLAQMHDAGIDSIDQSLQRAIAYLSGISDLEVVRFPGRYSLSSAA